ncbi:MAG: hypothetical protein F9K24_07110 [Leptonema illini]|jgi:hypothetical protein|uniref:Lipoprotein n=1 Tax=Leptonema illini TaxID=183 RepID=A0A833H2W1_9LEPT|nr:MAG: hypothetical protein F9K24_07110 [Leptonema illini]
MKKSAVILTFALLFSSCDVREILPNDLADPAHARYVASGDKEKDRRQLHAYFIICNELLQPYFRENYLNCMSKVGATDFGCSKSNLEFGVVVSCAAALVDYHPGARSDEFNNSESY